MKRFTGRALVGGCLATWLAATACRDSQPAPQQALEPGPPVVPVTMVEYSFQHEAAVDAGRLVFRIQNRGVEPHRLALAPLDGDLNTALDQLRAGRRPPALAAIPNQAPGMAGAFAVDLPAGRYALYCLVSDSGGNHALKGMASELQVR